ncbi:hypothetical protein [Flavobacterium sp. 3HN19-14]|uniref:hypothetical protein n=1 Tax=Flavobacterium sp. 3HN19-14 TaxID=3448133 RepID=UPI003EE04BDD
MKDFKLDDHPKIKSGFTAPEGYFDDFNDKIMSQLPASEPKVISIFARRKNWITAAAAVLVLGLMLPVYNHYQKNTELLDSVSLENYLSEESDISQYDLVNLLDKQDIENIDINLPVDDKTIEDVLTNENLENYITD